MSVCSVFRGTIKYELQKQFQRKRHLRNQLRIFRCLYEIQLEIFSPRELSLKKPAQMSKAKWTKNKPQPQENLDWLYKFFNINEKTVLVEDAECLKKCFFPTEISVFSNSFWIALHTGMLFVVRKYEVKGGYCILVMR